MQEADMEVLRAQVSAVQKYCEAQFESLTKLFKEAQSQEVRNASKETTPVQEAQQKITSLERKLVDLELKANDTSLTCKAQASEAQAKIASLEQQLVDAK